MPSVEVSAGQTQQKSALGARRHRKKKKAWKQYLPIYLMMIPVLIWFLVFKIMPIYGIQLAFKDYNIMKNVWGSPWVGFKHFQTLFSNYYFSRILINTLWISFLRLITSIPAAIIFALLLNELRGRRFKRITQTISYLPHFISWVVAGGIFNLLLSPQYGAVNEIIRMLGGDPIYFLGDDRYFVGVLIVTGIWKSIGWDSIIYLAALSGVNPELYESAEVDGANRLQRMWYISLPSLMPTIVMLTTLALAGILSGGFDQIYNMYNESVYSVADIIDTYVYRQGFEKADYSFSTAVGLFKSVIAFILVMTANYFSRRVVKYSMW